MPAPIKVRREDVLAAALELARREGMERINARSLAGALGCSTQPIFRNFASMEELRSAVLEAALAEYHRHMEAETAASPYPRYKAMGMAYISFARREPSLFRLLFMRDRRGEAAHPEETDWSGHTALAGQSAGLSPEEAGLFHLEMWTVVHGLAAMQATAYLDLEEATVSRVLTDTFLGIKHKWEEHT